MLGVWGQSPQIGITWFECGNSKNKIHMQICEYEGLGMEEEEVKKPKKRTILKLFIFFMIMGMLVVSFFGYQAYQFVKSAADPNGESFPIDIQKGSNLTTISKLLEEKKIISSATNFKLYAQFKGQAEKIKAGTFLLSSAWTPERILDELIKGDVILHKITIREGLPWWTVAELLEKEGYCTAEDFETVIHDVKFLRKYGIPFDNAEGFLYPDTYLLLKPTKLDLDSAEKIAGRLIDTFWAKTAKLWDDDEFNGEKPNKSRLKELITLASIVERETRVEKERPIVAGVYQNRLDKNMILQADPTIIYGLGKSFNGTIYKSNLEDRKNVYNTYIYNGLPPGPICSPSFSSMSAALNPAEHKYFYFVAKGIGAEHVFSKNLSEHNKAVRQYRENLRKQNK